VQNALPNLVESIESGAPPSLEQSPQFGRRGIEHQRRHDPKASATPLAP
jgi:hypothetical protein